MGHPIGPSEGLQSWESLVALCALRLWAPKWRQRRNRLSVKSDSVTALKTTLNTKAAGCGPALKARKLGLVVADALYTPNVIANLPGVASVIADRLSRVT